MDRDELVRAVRQAQFQRIFDPHPLLHLLPRRPSQALRALVHDIAPTQSPLEDAFLALCDRFHIPRPLTQYAVNGHRADFVWPAERVVVETDGWQAHGTPLAFQADRTVANALQLEGYAVLRFTHADVHHRPALVARVIRRSLAARAGPKV